MGGPAVMVVRVTVTVRVVVGHSTFDCAIRRGFLLKTLTDEALMMSVARSG
jgi:hypothetical protein